MSVVVAESGQLRDPLEEIKPVRDRIKQGREHRKTKMESTWASNIAFAKGQQWLVEYPRRSRKLTDIREADPRYANRELYTADVITEYRMSVLGELGGDDDRPELLTIGGDENAEKYQTQLNRALGYGWDHEWDGDEALSEADQLCVDLGTSAIQCRFNPSLGPPKGDMPSQNGQPLSYAAAIQALGNGVTPDVTMETIPEGRIEWVPRSAYNLIVPPGVTREADFPWECIIEAVPLSFVKERFPGPARELRDDKDITSSLGDASGAAGEGNQTLREHVWLFSYFERATQKHPQGRVFYFAGNDLRFMGLEGRLPYAKFNEKGDPVEWMSGIAYFHWNRVTGRFWSRSLVETLKDGQRAINNIRTDQMEILRKGKPWILADEHAPVKRTNIPYEIVRIPTGGRPPEAIQGLGPGEWMDRLVASAREDLEHASGVNPQTRGDAPSNVPNYAYLAALREADQTKRQPVIRRRKVAIATLIEATVYDMRAYWGHEKQVALAGDEGMVEAQVFDATKIPPFFIVHVPKGAPKPRSQAALLKMVEDVVHYSAEIGQPLPTSYYKESLESGHLLDLPEDEGDDQVEKAELENHRMLMGELVEPAYYDPPDIHIPIHRTAQIAAEQAGRMDLWQILDMHAQWHQQKADENAQRIAQMQASSQAALQSAQSEQMMAQEESAAEAEHARAMEQEQARARNRPQGGAK